MTATFLCIVLVAMTLSSVDSRNWTIFLSRHLQNDKKEKSERRPCLSLLFRGFSSFLFCPAVTDVKITERQHPVRRFRKKLDEHAQTCAAQRVYR